MNEIINMRDKLHYINGLINLIDIVYAKTLTQLTMIEVGSYQGESMEIFVNTGKVKTIACIDPWKSGYDKKDRSSYTDMSIVENKFNERKSALDSIAKIIKHKGTLDTFIVSDDYKQFTNENSIDLVYIDACHRYKSCLHDITICKNIIKPKIAISGHDYTKRKPGVVSAVNKIFGRPDCIFSDKSWINFSTV